MPVNFKVITGANMFCDEDPGASHHIELMEIALPSLNRIMETHQAGGAFMELAIDMDMIEALTLPFKLAGINAEMLGRAGYNDSIVHDYTVFKHVRNARTQTSERLTCVVRGQMGQAEQDTYNKRGLSGFDYEVRGIQSYFLQLGTQVIYDLDFFGSRRIIMGRDMNAERAGILGIT